MAEWHRCGAVTVPRSVRISLALLVGALGVCEASRATAGQAGDQAEILVEAKGPDGRWGPAGGPAPMTARSDAFATYSVETIVPLSLSLSDDLNAPIVDAVDAVRVVHPAVRTSDRVFPAMFLVLQHEGMARPTVYSVRTTGISYDNEGRIIGMTSGALSCAPDGTVAHVARLARAGQVERAFAGVGVYSPGGSRMYLVELADC